MFARYYCFSHRIVITFAAVLVGGSLLYADKKVTGDLGVEGNSILEGTLDVLKGLTVKEDTDLMGNIFSIGHSLNSDGTQNYGIAGLEIYIKNTNSTTRLIEHVTTIDGTTFKWGTRAATDLNANGILDDFGNQWMSLDRARLTVSRKLLINGTDVAEGSLPLDVQIGEVSKFSVDKSGNVAAAGNLTMAGQPVLTQAQAAAAYLTPAQAATVYLTSAQAAVNYLQNGGTGLVMGTRVNGAVAADSIALGQGSYASPGSISIGFEAGSNGVPASGEQSVAFGSRARASGLHAVALGKETLAEGAESAALGHGATTRELGGVALGQGAESTQVGQVVLGSFNTVSPRSSTPLPTDDLLVLGNGNGIPGDVQEKSNALVIKRNGDAQIKGSVSVTGVIRVSQPAGGISMGEFVNP